jgi:hypothetical protein
LIVASVSFAPLAEWVGIPVAILGAIVWAVVQWGVSGSISNFINWMLGQKQDIVCLLYQNLPSIDLAAAAVRDFIDADEELSYLDKQVLKSVLASSWHYSWIIADQEENGTWDEYIQAGYCDACEELPTGCQVVTACDLEDWEGGTVVCSSGRAQVRGGQAVYTGAIVTVPAEACYGAFSWYPRSDGNPTAAATFSLRAVAGGSVYNIVSTGAQPVDVEHLACGAIPGALWGVECYLVINQVSYWAEPNYFCATIESLCI